MAPKDTQEILILDKLKISSKEIVLYLELLNSQKYEILKVLKRKPVLENYKKLEWVKEFKLERIITKKLKTNTRLSTEEKSRLTTILNEAVVGIKKLHRKHGNEAKTIPLEKYISDL